jgi:hypothetical protein
MNRHRPKKNDVIVFRDFEGYVNSGVVSRINEDYMFVSWFDGRLVEACCGEDGLIEVGHIEDDIDEGRMLVLDMK